MKGFTVLELMIVVTIIGILAAVAIPAFTDQVGEAKQTVQPIKEYREKEKCRSGIFNNVHC